jgi:hypothetical protein
VGLTLNGIQYLLACTDDVNLVGDSIVSRQKNVETISNGIKEVGIEINAEKTKCM